MKKSKILFILHLPNPIHGAAVVDKLIKDSKIVNEIFDADYINLSTSNQLDQIGKGGVSKIINLLKIQLKVVKALSSKKYDLTYMTLTAKAPGFYKDFFIVFILKIFRGKIIYHLHNKGISSKQNYKLDNLLYKITFRNTQTILLSPFLYDDIKKYVKKENVYYCPNAISPHPGPPLKKEISQKKAPFNILFLSNMMKEKGVFVLLEACKLLKQKGYSFECHFVGDWFDISQDQFNKQVSAEDLNSFVYAHGKKYGTEKFVFFSNADIFVFPTYYHNETFGLVLIEAMEFGLPIISTPEGGIPDVIADGETGFLVPQRNSETLVEKIELLMAQPELCYKMGIAGNQRFKDLFSLEKFENRLSDILNQAIIAH